MTYKEHIYQVCNATDLDDKDDVIETMQYLAKELIDFQDLCLVYDNKLQEAMTAKGYLEWSTEKAKEKFKKDIDDMEDSEFKTFCEKNFDILTDDSLSYEEAARKIGERDA